MGDALADGANISPRATYRSLKPDLSRHKGRGQSNQGENQHDKGLHCVLFGGVEAHSPEVAFSLGGL